MQRLSRYIAVGAVATSFHYAALIVLVENAGWPAFASAGAGAVLGAQVAFIGNRWFTFRHRGPLGDSWLRFQLTGAIGAALGMAIVACAVRLGIHYVIGQIVSTVFALLLTYAVNRRWAFAKPIR